MDPGPQHPSTYRHFSPGNAAGSGGGDLLLFLAIPAGRLIGLSASLCSRALSAFVGLLLLPPASLVGALRRAAPSLARAALAFAALAAAFAASLLLGFFLVRRCSVEGPVSVRRPLYFDYTEQQPSAAVSLAGAAASIPAGHSVKVSVALLLPDSDHNRQIGVFQIKAEAIAATGVPIATATRPYMLRYKSGAVRLAQSALAIVPLATGLMGESQSATIRDVLQYREEGNKKKRTGLVRVSLQPRAMTVALPEVYSAEVLVQTALPGWSKALARVFRWSLCVWASGCAYVLLSVLAVCAWVRWRPADRRRVDGRKAIADLGGRDDDGAGELSGDVVVRWRERRGRRQRRIHGGRDGIKRDEGSASAAAVGDLLEPSA
ncbi:seipin-1 [Brachypodium distachyon]|uniref:Uncharacterized protein n=1 Tax=Brachypodium distachyon TaxID=15368 RepID=A0A0Q3ENM1_BRADI|nr:seipin-1 [Brachypodium distachyon]KQJ89110.1 hypothetical protein BRADI_4g23531v3 [Brachypodium distachyon]PNT64015.1 hypothetical protein BRADI_4g23531v3 [Brachypodium distachyon]|eukprot:XP_014758335.1 seipin-1 [Brachypodium distachyon]